MLQAIVQWMSFNETRHWDLTIIADQRIVFPSCGRIKAQTVKTVQSISKQQHDMQSLSLSMIIIITQNGTFLSLLQSKTHLWRTFQSGRPSIHSVFLLAYHDDIYCKKTWLYIYEFVINVCFELFSVCAEVKIATLHNGKYRSSQ